MTHDLPHVGPRPLPPSRERLAPEVAPELPPAPLVARSIAGLLDLAVIWVALFWYALALGVDPADPSLSTTASVLFALAALAYPFVFEAAVGWTPGKRALGLRVVLGGGDRLTWSAALRRTLARPIDSMPWLVPYALGILWTLATGPERRQRIGDLWAGSKVVRLADLEAVSRR